MSGTYIQYKLRDRYTNKKDGNLKTFTAIFQTFPLHYNKIYISLVYQFKITENV